MTDQWIIPDTVFDGHDIRHATGVRIVDGTVTEVGPAPRGGRGGITVAGCLTPGFVDVQVNGGGGVMVNTTPTRDGMATIAKAHRRFGTTHLMPTVITDAPVVLAQAAEAALAARGDQGILGLHIEGPHIAQARRGTHDPGFIRPLDEDTMQIVLKLRDAGVAVMITLAPEAATVAQIAQLAAMGAVVSLGHTDAAAHQIEDAIAAGATCATHLFNAMSQMQGRAPGAVGAVLGGDIRFGLIADGHHVDDRMIRLALRMAGGDDRAFVVSDAMATVGGPDHFVLYNRTITLDNGRLVNSDGNLAGAHTTMADAVVRLTRHIGVPLATALRMAVTTPATLIGRPDLGQLVNRPTADLLLLDADHTVRGTLRDAMEKTPRP